MPTPTLVVSHPPHGEADLRQAGAVLGLVPADVRLKANYPIPEIWLAHDDAGTAESAAATLRRAGLRAVAVPGVALVAVPPQELVLSFAFEEMQLVLQADIRATIDYDAKPIAVVFTPRPGEAKGPLPPPSVDLFVPGPTGFERWTVLPGVTGFAGVAARQTASFGVNVRAFATDVERRFQYAHVDRRLLNMQVRLRTGTPPPGAVRRGYSFATPALQQLLESIAPGFSAIEHEELSVRLAFLTHAAE